jgi:hypothetical protein
MPIWRLKEYALIFLNSSRSTELLPSWLMRWSLCPDSYHLDVANAEDAATCCSQHSTFSRLVNVLSNVPKTYSNCISPNDICVAGIIRVVFLDKNSHSNARCGLLHPYSCGPASSHLSALCSPVFPHFPPCYVGGGLSWESRNRL